jgi:primary-amine oxidase
MEDLQAVEHVCRKDPKVIEQCVISGIPKEDMHKVYCDRRSIPTANRDVPNIPSLDNWLRS